MYILVQNIFLALGGLGLFLLGMKMMMDGLEALAGNRMRTIVAKATSNRFFGVGVGALVTVIIQSSTATSVMAIGFINAGLMSLSQAISIIIGAHIGTTLTAHFLTFGLDLVAPLFIFIGIVLYLFFRKKKGIKDFGFVFLGIGVLFFGLSVMGEPLREFAQTSAFQSMLTAFENPFLAILSGFVFTAIIQSSTAATGILISLYLGGADLDFRIAAFLILGISAGTTVTALVASLAGRRESKRAALANFIFISIGCVVFGGLIVVFPDILDWFVATWHDGARQVAMFYTFFKIGLTIMFLPFIGHLSNLIYKIMPKRGRNADSMQLLHIKTSSLQPDAVIPEAFNELTRMSHMVLDNIKLALAAVFTGESDKADSVVEAEAGINYLTRQITSLLMQIQNVSSAEQMKKVSTMLYIAADLERIGDHAENISEYNIRTPRSRTLRLPIEAVEELQLLSGEVIEVLTLMVQVFYTPTDELIKLIYEREQRIDEMCKGYIENHIARIKAGDSDARGGVVFVNMISDLERCSDHANNIAFYFLDDAY